MSNFFSKLFRSNQNVYSYGVDTDFHTLFDSSFKIGSIGKKYIKIACSVEIIDTILIYLSNWFSKGVPYELTPEGERIVNSDLIDLINQPNTFQAKEEFMAEFFYYLHAAGTNYIYPVDKAVGFEGTLEGTALLNLNFDNIEEPQKSKSIFDLNDDILFKYVENLSGEQKTKEFNFSEVIPFYDSTNGLGGRMYKGKSRLESIKDEIKNIYLATKGKQNKLDLSGIVLVTPQDRAGGDRSMSKGLDKVIHTDDEGVNTTHKDHIEGKFKASGLTKGRSIIVSSTELKAMNLSESLEKIQFDPQRIEDCRTIKRKYGVPENLLPLTPKGATFENQDKETLNMLQTLIEPISFNLGSSISKRFESKNTLMFDYSHLPAYSIIEKEKVASQEKIVTMYLNMVKEGVITPEQANNILKDKGIL